MMKWKRIFVALSMTTMLGAAGCGDSAENANNVGGNNGGNNGRGIEHPNLACSEIDEGTLCNITGEIREDLTLENDGTIYQLSGPVFVGDDASETVLTIEPGVTVYADPASSQTTFLTVRRSSKIVAEGTAAEPIVFTPAADQGERSRGMWGGLILNGRAPLNTGSEAAGEGDTGLYGGDDPDDSSGVLKYVRVEFAGDLITSEDELNGIAFQGVGRGTTVDYVQVHMNSDDGVEFFGGTVDARHLVLTGIGDDSLDWTDGWQGNVQFVLAQQYDDKADRGIEADNLKSDNDAGPRSHPTISNATLIGSAEGDTGVLLRRGTAANLYNFVIVDFAKACVDLDDAATYAHGWGGGDFSGELTMVNSLINGCAALFDEDDSDEAPFTVQQWFEGGQGNQASDPMLGDAHSVDAPDFTPRDGSPALADSVQPEGNGFFEPVDFIGAMGAEDWTEGWTIRSRD